MERCPKGEQQRRKANDVAPVSQSLGSGGGTLRLRAQGGHFYATTKINGVPTRVLIDTGATFVSISASAARRIGLGWTKGVAVTSHTANGATAARGVILGSVELNGNIIHQVPGIIMTSDFGPSAEVLLGMSFLKHFDVSTDGYNMTLRPK